MTNFLWLDLESSGLVPEKHRILEVAAVLDVSGERDSKLPPTPVVNTPIFSGPGPCPQAQYLSEMPQDWDPFCWKMHQESGLVGAIRTGPRCELFTVEDALLAALAPYKPGTVMLAGNSVHFDRGFIHWHMPRLDEVLHYRHMDVSCLATFLDEVACVERETEKPHRAFPDVKLSIKNYYRYSNMVHDWRFP